MSRTCSRHASLQAGYDHLVDAGSLACRLLKELLPGRLQPFLISTEIHGKRTQRGSLDRVGSGDAAEKGIAKDPELLRIRNECRLASSPIGCLEVDERRRPVAVV